MVDRRRVPQGSTIKGALKAVNNSAETVDITHPSGCPTEYGLYFDGKLRTELWFCTAETVPDELAPHETRVWRLELIVRGELSRYDEGGQHEYHPVSPGHYDLFDGITAYQRLEAQEGDPHPYRVRGGTWFAPPVSIEVLG
jgi:hypothetical protein